MIIDLIVIVILLISGAIAFLRGFIREVLTILGVIGGAAAAYALGPRLAVYFNQWLGVKEGVEPERLFGIVKYDLLAQILAYGSVFLVVVIVLSVVSHVLAGAARSLGLGPIDRTLGFLFGLVRGLILLALLYLPVHIFVDQETKDLWFAGSHTHFYIEQTADAMEEYIPESTKKDVEKGIEDLQKANETREKVNSIDLLKQNGLKPGEKLPEGEQPVAPVQAAPEQGQPPADQGYKPEDRQQLDDLINRQTTP